MSTTHSSIKTVRKLELYDFFFVTACMSHSVVGNCFDSSKFIYHFTVSPFSVLGGHRQL